MLVLLVAPTFTNDCFSLQKHVRKYMNKLGKEKKGKDYPPIWL